MLAIKCAAADDFVYVFVRVLTIYLLFFLWCDTIDRNLVNLSIGTLKATLSLHKGADSADSKQTVMEINDVTSFDNK